MSREKEGGEVARNGGGYHSSLNDDVDAQASGVNPSLQALYSLGVLVCFSVSSLSQEALASSGVKGVPPFHYETTLVFAQSASAVVASLIAQALLSGRTCTSAQCNDEARQPSGGLSEWMLMIGAYYASHYFGLASLRHLSYPVHVTCKSCKAIPMALGERLLTTKRHSTSKTLGVVVLCVGAAGFLLGGRRKNDGGTTTALGVGLVCLALVADGIYAGTQVNIVQRCASEFTLMLHMNAWQGLFSGAFALYSGELVVAGSVALTHTRIARSLAAFMISKALGTLFVYKLLRQAGTLVVATVTTLRKVLSVLFSVIIFRHALAPAQYACLVLVFLHKYVGDALLQLAAKFRLMQVKSLEKRD